MDGRSDRSGCIEVSANGWLEVPDGIDASIAAQRFAAGAPRVSLWSDTICDLMLAGF